MNPASLVEFGWASLEFNDGCPPVPADEDPCSQPGAPQDASLAVSWGSLEGPTAGEFRERLEFLKEPSDFRRAAPLAVWLDRGRLLISSLDGQQSRLRLASLMGGPVDGWWTDPRPIQEMVGDPSTGAVYVSLVDPRDRSDLAIWLIQKKGASATQVVQGRKELQDIR